ncbi:hypothetical protein Smp_140230 [Schistosoma mansoni]|uniref:hypothetical protein n=1 Tax=Schistosoma mansoni TaxID=6183 RepID=UPI0001A638D7|nr:hypothetical protein Smp_140230 [Schistosoma mansoni]|eukprot:XP_018653564.1 hypothetical protein Smp_140230 [Schistosoma mansoni]
MFCIQYQAMQRHNAAWQESLRYRFPELDRLGGLKRITLNDNPKICDEGSTQLADALIDDLWVKAIDLQACNLSDSSASTWLAVLIGLRIPNGNQSMTHDEIHLKSNRSSTIDDQHRGNHSLVVLDLRRNPNISRDLLRAVTERALINSEGKQTEFSWLKAGSQTPSQLCSGVTTYPWPGLTNMSNHIPGIDLINPYNRSVKSSNSYRTRSRSNNSLYNHEKIIHSDDKNVCIYHKNNLSDRPPFIPAGGRPRCRSADPAHYLDHRTHHKCNVDLHRKHNRHLHCSDSGQPLSERAVWKPPGVAKTIQKAYYSRPTTPLSSRTSFSGGIPWRTAARASRSRGYPSFQCPGKTCLESRALHLDYNLVNKQSSNVNNINQNNNKSVILPYAKTLNRVVADGCHCQHHHQPQTQQQRLGHNRQKSCSKINSRISSPELSGMNFQHKLKHLMTKVSQLEKDLQTEKRKSDRLLKNRQFVQQVNKSKHLLKIDQDSIYQLRNFICRLTNMIETLQNSKNKSNASNEELTVLQDTFEELCSLISRITEEENDFDEGEKQIQDILENVNKKHSSTYCNEISSIKKNKQINKIEKCMNHTKQSFKHKPIVNNHEKCNTKQVKGHIQWKTIAKTRAVQTESPQSPQKNDEKLMDNRKFIQHKYEVSNPHIEWIPSTCTNTTTHTNIKGTMSNSYHDNDNNNIINNTKVIPLHSEDEQEQSQITSNTSINSNNNNLWIKNHETINHKNGIDDHNNDELFNELIRDNIDSPISNPTDYDVNSVDYDDDDDQLSSTSTSLLLDNSNPIYQSTNNSLISTEN